jgi:N-hydroxyarylamine O-acetyltransferase
MKLPEYLSRIGYHGRVAPDRDCLAAIHRHHLFAIPYENVDVQLERPLDLDIERIFDKIVHRRRGGWCYEMNGLLGWALGEVGFDVMRMAGGVGRRERGDDMLGNHLVLGVELDRTWIADVGLGNGLVEPIPLAAGTVTQFDREYGLEDLGDGFWRFLNSGGAIPPDFDFRFAAADETLLARTCATLQSDDESVFRQNLICQRLRPEGVHFLLGRMLIVYGKGGPSTRTLESTDEFRDVLSSVFGLDDVEHSELWSQVLARHEALFAGAVEAGTVANDG